MLKLIDLGAEDIEEAEGDIEILIESRLLGEMKNKIEEAKLTVKEAELIYHPSNLIDLDENIKAKAIDFLKKLDEMDDVQNIFTNLNL
jgi:transcriptional/translational regulatory protein YebC/TACO1